MPHTTKHEALLGLRVQTEMLRQGLTIPKLAKAADLPLSTVQKIVAGKGNQPSVWTVCALARILKTRVDYLCGVSTDACP
jgi:predicted transcriptional regulator